jgi:crotonobetainyl-CoA:carnitine CoA-transferase CaiB-like acyl-CoA transferase
MTIEGPLSGIRVLDCTQAHAGPFGTLLLGDLGAEIIKIEPPTGDMLRLGQKEVSPLLYYIVGLSRNKKSLVLDLSGPKGKQAFYDLVKISDVVISNNRPDVPLRQGTDYETLEKINPGIIRVNISGYGETGPYSNFPSYDIIACGHSGILSISGEPGRPPVTPGGIALADMLGGFMAAFQTLAALVGRGRDGRGAKLSPNLLDSLLLFQQVMFQSYFVSGNPPGPQGNRHLVATPYGVYQTADGYITIGPTDADKVASLVGLGWMASDERFNSAMNRMLNRSEFEKHLEEALLKKTSAQWLKILRDENDIACGPILNYEQVINDPQVQENAMITQMEAGGQTVKTIGSVFKMPGKITGEPEPPPDLGQHTRQILESLLNYDDAAINEVLAENEAAVPRLKGRLKKL